MILIFFLSANLLFSRNIAVLLGDFKTKDGSYMNKIAVMLEKRGFEVIKDIEVDTTSSFSFGKQDLEVNDELFDKFILDEKDNLILIGHSQGGIRARRVYNLARRLTNVKAIFTISTPWQGASILIRRKEIVNEIINLIDNLDKCKEYLNELSDSISTSTNKINECIETAKHIKNMVQDNLDCLGIKDILPNSDIINELNESMEKVPIFNIISSCDKYNPNMKKINKYKEQINKLVEYAKKLSVINNVLLMDKTIENNNITEDAAKQVIYASKSINDLISLLNELIEFNKEDNNGILTIKEQQLPKELNKAQCKLRNKEGTLGYLVKGIHRSVTDNHEGTVYDNDEVVNYIFRSIDNNFNPVLKDEDVR